MCSIQLPNADWSEATKLTRVAGIVVVCSLSRGVTIKGNRIVDGRSLDIEDLGGPGTHVVGYAILAAPPGWVKEYPQLISGIITIEDNYIDVRYRHAEPDDPWGARAHGIPLRGLQSGFWFLESEADVTIKASEIYNIEGSAISSSGNDGITSIIDNLVYIPNPDSTIRSESYGIEFCGWFWYDA